MVTIYDINGNVLNELNVSDTSSSYRSIDGRHELTLKYSVSSPSELPIGAWCLFQNEKFELMSHQDVKMRHSKHYEYTVVLKGSYGLLSRFKIKNPVDGRLKFDMVAKPKEFLEVIISNLNDRDGGWSIGECIDVDEKLISFNHTYCDDALKSVANVFNTEFEVIDKRISLKKVEYNRSNPLRLEYGKGNGLRPGVGRTNYEDGLPVVTMFVQGGSKNISYKDYGSIELHLPKSYSFMFDGERFEGEEGYESEKAREFATDHLGSSVTILNGKIGREDSIDLSEIYPSRVGHVSKVVFQYKDLSYPEPDPSWTEEQWNEVQVDIYDDSIPEDLDYSQCLLENNEPLTVAFQSGELAGREFDATFIKKGNLFEIEKQEYSGQPMPQGVFIPKAGDTYAVFNVSLPDSYISNESTHSGAEFDALREATRALYEKSDPRFTFSGEIDDIWAKKNWVNVGGKLKIGGYVSFVNEEITTDGPVLVRIVGITQNINNPHCPKIQLSNVTHKGSVSSRISQIEDREAHVDELHKDSRQFTKRRFADIKRAMKMLEDAFGEGFDPSLKPVTIQTMMMLVGDETLQFAFVEAIGSDKVVPHKEYFDTETKTFKCDAGFIKHYTLDVKEIRSKFDQTYRYWTMPQYESAVLDDASKEYYVYAIVSKVGDNLEINRFSLEPSAIGMRDKESEGEYYLLLGLLLAERDGGRDYLPLYGFTQILPGQVTTDVIRSADGQTYFDLVNGVITGKIRFEAGSTGLENIEGYLNIGNQNMLRNSGFTGDYLSEPLADETVMDAAKVLYSDPLDHWDTNGTATVINLDRATSGKGVSLVPTEELQGHLSQNLYNKTISGESYVISFYAKTLADSTANVSVNCGGVQSKQEVTGEWKKYTLLFEATATRNEFSIYTDGEVTICDLQLERGTIATSWGMSPLDNSSDRTYYQALKYLSQALAGSTTMAGGLVLTNTILLGNESNNSEFVERAGANGLYFNDDDTPAFWAGGKMQQAIETIAKYKDNPGYEPTEEELKSMAQFVVTHGGRAILNNIILRGYVYALGGQFKGKVEAEEGYFKGAIRYSFAKMTETCRRIDSTTYELQDTSATYIQLDGSDTDMYLRFPDDVSFNGWSVKVFAPRRVSRLDPAYTLLGNFLYMNTVNSDGFYDIYSQVYFDAGGYVELIYNNGWIIVTIPSSGVELIK